MGRGQGRGQKAAHRVRAEELAAQNLDRKDVRALLNMEFPNVASTELAKAIRRSGYGYKYRRGGRGAVFLPRNNTVGGENLDAAFAAEEVKRLKTPVRMASGRRGGGASSCKGRGVSVARSSTSSDESSSSSTVSSAEEQPVPLPTPLLPRRPMCVHVYAFTHAFCIWP